MWFHREIKRTAKFWAFIYFWNCQISKILWSLYANWILFTKFLSEIFNEKKHLLYHWAKFTNQLKVSIKIPMLIPFLKMVYLATAKTDSIIQTRLHVDIIYEYFTVGVSKIYFRAVYLKHQLWSLKRNNNTKKNWG